MSDVRWRGLTHEQIYQRVWTGPGPVGSTDAQALWSQVETKLREIDATLAAATARIAGGWEGAAASVASHALSPLGSWTNDAAGDALLTANGLTGQAEQVAWLRGNLPPPGSPGLPEEPPQGLNDPGLDPYFLADWHQADAVRAEAAAQAVHVMETYTSNTWASKRDMSYWTPPPAVTAEVAAPVSAGAGGGVGAVGVGSEGGPAALGPAGALAPSAPSAPPPPGAPAGPGAASPPGSTVAPVPIPLGSAGGGANRGRAVPTGPGPPPSTSTGTGRTPFRPVVPGVQGPGPTPTTWRPAARRTPGGPDGDRPGGPPPLSPRAATPWSTGAGSGLPRPSPDPGPPGRGAAVDRAPIATGPNSETGRAGGGRTASGHPAMMPMGMGAGPGRGDQEHRRPDYLLDASDAFFDDRWFPPPVIGADDPFPAARHGR